VLTAHKFILNNFLTEMHINWIGLLNLHLISLAMNCPGVTVFQQCGSLCPQTCDYLNETCYNGCAEGCFCPAGQIAGRDGVCRPMTTCLNGQLTVDLFMYTNS